MADSSRVPRYFDTSDCGQVGLHASRWDERHRRLRVVLPVRASCWDYAPLIDVVRPGARLHEHRYLGLSAAEWLVSLRQRSEAEWQRARVWFEARVQEIRSKLDRRPRSPNNDYAVELASPPVLATLPNVLARLGLKRATSAQWLATINGLSAKGVKAEEIRQSGLISSFDRLPADATQSLEGILASIDLAHVHPRLVCESAHGFTTNSGWRECCIVESGTIKRNARKRRRGAIGNGRDVVEIIRYRHRTFGWSLMRQKYFADLLGRREDHWRVLDERGQPVHASDAVAFADAQQAMDAAETAMGERFSAWCKARDLPKWQNYTLRGGSDYREILVQIDDWPYSYQPRHFRTRNVLIHIRSGLRTTSCGRRLLYLDEVQSDWHADLHAEAKVDLRRRRKTVPPPAPFAKEWPLLALKLMLWWAQRIGADGLAWSTADLQELVWAGHKPPRELYDRDLPEAAAQLARTLTIPMSEVEISFRTHGPWVALGERGWIVHDSKEIPLTKPFATREQAEHFADLIDGGGTIGVPCLLLEGLPRIQSIPLFGVGRREDWLRAEVCRQPAINSAKQRLSVDKAAKAEPAKSRT
jgi:hypothetical protein